MVLIVKEDLNIDWKNSEGGIGMEIDIIVGISHDEKSALFKTLFSIFGKAFIKNF